MRSFSGPGWISFSVSAERERERVQHLINLHEQPAAANEKDLKMSAVAAFAKALLRVAEFKRDTQTPSWLVHLIFNTTPSPDPYWCTILWDWISGLYNQVVKKCFSPPRLGHKVKGWNENQNNRSWSRFCVLHSWGLKHAARSTMISVFRGSRSIRGDLRIKS